MCLALERLSNQFREGWEYLLQESELIRREWIKDIVMGWSTGAFGFSWSAYTEPDAEKILGADRIDDILYAVVSGRSG